jgi:hypothetical protein
LFNIKIQVEEDKNFSKLEDPIEYDDDLDDITSLVMDICSYLDEVSLISFIVEGFKEMKWPVDVRTDLSSIIPQVPVAIKKLADRQECDIQFFEQGIERELRFKCNDGKIIVECYSLLGDPVTAETEIIQYDELLMMFKSLMDSFIKTSKYVCPKITNHYLFKEWESAYYDTAA